MVVPVSQSLPFQEVASCVPPEPESKPLFKCNHHTFNHLYEYAIKSGVIWYRQNQWKPLSFQGKPIHIDCDGANFIVVDDKSYVHFKKIIKEERNEERYTYEDIHNDGEWRKTWCVLPYLSPIINFVSDHMLKLDGYKALAISHRGRFNDFVEDNAQQKHISHVGVSTLYVLDKSGRFILMFDPWMPIWSRIEIQLPETDTTYFVAENISVSASTIMAIGYEINTVTKTKELKIITRLVDVDTEGGNPWFAYDYHPNESGDKTWVLPVDAKWQYHPLNAAITKKITILQTGQGKAARVMRVQGQNGYYEKMINDPEWAFHLNENDKAEGYLPLKVEAEVISHDTHKYTGLLMTPEPIASLKLNHFGWKNPHTQVEMHFKGKNYILDIYARYNFWNFLGYEGRNYDLVVPTELNEVFGSKKVVPLSIQKKGEGIEMTVKSFAEKYFAFVLVPFKLNT